MIKKIIDKYFDIPENFFVKKNKYLLIGTLLGCGYFKKAPGTFASFLTLLIILVVGQINTNILIPLTILSLIVGIFIAEKVSTQEEPDPKYFVLDEFVGQSIALLLVSHNIILSILAFILFRIFDITKPWIIKEAETHFKGGIAIMMDDILAGFFSLLCVLFISLFIG